MGLAQQWCILGEIQSACCKGQVFLHPKVWSDIHISPSIPKSTSACVYMTIIKKRQLQMVPIIVMFWFYPIFLCWKMLVTYCFSLLEKYNEYLRIMGPKLSFILRNKNVGNLESHFERQYSSPDTLNLWKELYSAFYNPNSPSVMNRSNLSTPCVHHLVLLYKSIKIIFWSLIQHTVVGDFSSSWVTRSDFHPSAMCDLRVLWN